MKSLAHYKQIEIFESELNIINHKHSYVKLLEIFDIHKGLDTFY